MAIWDHLELKKDLVVLRGGLAFKKGSRRHWWSLSNWKLRYIVLTDTKLSYYTPMKGKIKGSIDLRDCTPRDIQIMPSDCPKTGSSKSSIWRIAIRTPSRRFVMAALSEADMMAWVDALDSVISGRPRLSSSADTRPSSMLLDSFKDVNPRKTLATNDLLWRDSWEEVFASVNVPARPI
ncbi:hypothetical protein LEN26_002622 [Aphanomyces euteiches]|nr:hypothetical protein AeMF1_018645 [Aphanomyces euteiches]KAH9158946.1 hypothetical protein LEN26_002622 [Aphanomyces euteiches]KAH9181004.1 hypothetical protein AeNC1_017021 [Aphanomyces euteiches]